MTKQEQVDTLESVKNLAYYIPRQDLDLVQVAIQKLSILLRYVDRLEFEVVKR